MTSNKYIEDLKIAIRGLSDKEPLAIEGVAWYPVPGASYPLDIVDDIATDADILYMRTHFGSGAEGVRYVDDDSGHRGIYVDYDSISDSTAGDVLSLIDIILTYGTCSDVIRKVLLDENERRNFESMGVAKEKSWIYRETKERISHDPFRRGNMEPISLSEIAVFVMKEKGWTVKIDDSPEEGSWSYLCSFVEEWFGHRYEYSFHIPYAKNPEPAIKTASDSFSVMEYVEDTIARHPESGYPAEDIVAVALRFQKRLYELVSLL